LVPDINWGRISRAIDYYKYKGYKHVGVPWTVSEQSIMATLDNPAKLLKTKQGCPVGSGEQAFIERIREGDEIKKAVCCTPCFRMEDKYDKYHLPYFMKVELIDNTESRDGLSEIIGAASKFLEYEGIPNRVVIMGDGTLDLEDSNGLELGSYGVRDLGDIKYVYGTGLAEPRTSYAYKIKEELT
jgi:seryl-tRNA synthetase